MPRSSCQSVAVFRDDRLRSGVSRTDQAFTGDVQWSVVSGKWSVVNSQLSEINGQFLVGFQGTAVVSGHVLFVTGHWSLRLRVIDSAVVSNQ